MYRTLAAATTVAAIAAGAAFGIGLGTDADPPPAPEAEGPGAGSRLVAFASCDAFLSDTRARAAAMVRPWGVVVGGRMEDLAAADMAPTAQAEAKVTERSSTSPAAPGAGFSGTNVQEAGVDEPDIMKTDGSTMFTAVGAAIHAVDVTGGGARDLGVVSVTGAGNQILLSGDRLLVIGGGEAPGAEERTAASGVSGTMPAWGPQGVVLTLLDVSNPAAMTVVETLRLEGLFVSARLTGNSVRVVISTPPELPAMQPPDGPGPLREITATLRNRQAMAATAAEAWLPSYAVDRAGQPGESRPLVECEDVRRPADDAGLGMVTVATLDLDKGVTPVDTDAIQTDGHVVYGSTTSLYVATSGWSGADVMPAGGAATQGTQIHRFDMSAAGSTDYRGSGRVDGRLLSQWSMSEHEGVLRVASTRDGTWSGDQPEPSESYVTTLDVGEKGLTPRARVGGLGRTEQIYAVRFMGDTGYVVTFRQTDPLYVIDLSDPGHPRMRGELKIPGYSAYLHPVGDGLLLGVGQDATDEGRVKGTQVSLFDVSDPAAPRRVSRRTFPGSWSEAESDHHAFLHWAATGLTVIPMQGPNADGTFSSRAVAVSVRAGEDIREIGGIVHEPTPGAEVAIRRSAVVGDALYTVSDAGVAADNMDDLTRRAWVPFS